MNDDLPTGDLEGVLGKLSFLSRVLGEVDDWLESSRPVRGPDGPSPGARLIHPATLDFHVARESAGS